MFVIHAHIRGSAHTLSLSELPLVVGLLLATPQDLVLAQVAGPVLVLLFIRGSAPVKVAFNVAQFALTATLTVVVLHALLPVPAEIGPGVWTATFVAVAAGSLVAAALVLAAIALAEGSVPSLDALRMLAADLVVSLTNTSIGLAGATLIAQDWHAGWLILPPAAVLILAYRAYLSEHTKHQSLDFLYGVARSLTRAPDIESALVDLLARTRESFRVRTAEIILFGTAGDVPLRTSLDVGGPTQTMQPVGHELATALRACLREEQAVVVVRDAAPDALASYLAEHGISEAAIAPVPGETRLVGVMVLGDRLGAATDFTKSDLRLFETLAGHAGMSLEFDRLEQAIRRMRELQGALERQAYRDPLTDLANRALFMRRVHESLTRPRGTGTVLFLDLDDFKRINDHAGHAAGDAVLIAAAERIRRCVRPTDLAARLGGDEFAVLLEDADERHGEEVAHRVLALLSEAVTISGQPCWVRASIGIASASAGSGMDADDLMRHADIAMYRAKEAGKGQVRTFAADMHPNALTKTPSRDEILAALEAGEFVAHYQPIVAVGSGEFVAAEALARWKHPRHGLLAPSMFVPAAEATGTIPGIDRAVLEQACREAAAWTAEDGYAPDAAVHVNLSGEGLRTNELVGVVEEVLGRTGLVPRRLVLELTESVLIAELPTAQPVLAALRALGVRIALDDFGTGYSSLACLRSLPVDILKVAKPFVDGAGRTPHDHALLAMIIELGSLFGVSVVAEGIERQDQLDAIADLSCEMAQGFYLGRPLDGETRRFTRRDPLAAAA
ncbi:MAG TPA: sensor domain-containing phosphodiesterase [Solirubrobacteraceae bacterium]|nr:sensor domain-containing phosphodiesterase [Solirubrobacteraceae bacterium]